MIIIIIYDDNSIIDKNYLHVKDLNEEKCQYLNKKYIIQDIYNSTDEYNPDKKRIIKNILFRISIKAPMSTTQIKNVSC